MTDALMADDQLTSLLAEIPAEGDEAPPRIVVGLHKSGSTMVTGLFTRLLKSLDLPLANLARMMHQRDIPPRIWENDPRMAQVFRPGVSYVGFRGLPKFMDADFIAASRMIVLVRDPRDALVSGFFSFGPGGSHVRPPGEQLRAEQDAARKEDEGLDIDQWVIKHAVRFGKQFRDILPLKSMPTVKIYRYEDVLFDKARLLADVFAHFGLPLPANAAAIAERHHVLPGKEDPSKHIRKATPGDHRDKLTPETIAELDRILAEPLRFYGYTS